MIILQILLIPFVTLLLLGAVFMIGAAVQPQSMDTSQNDQSNISKDAPESLQCNCISSPSIPLVKF